MNKFNKNLAVSAIGVLLACPAFADSQAKPASMSSGLNFTSADHDNNGRLEKRELQPLAEQRNADAEKWLQKYDQDNDDALSQNEFKQLSDSKDATAQQGSGEGAKIVVNQKPATVNVTKPAAKVTVTQPKPEVTITTRDPEVSVQQPEPEVSVQQDDPEVSVDAAKPVVGIEQGRPDVEVRQQEPDVQVQEPEPEISARKADPTAVPMQPRAQAQTGQEPRDTAATRELAEVPAANTVSPAQTLYQVPLQELRSGDILNSDGDKMGTVEDVVIRNDGGHAGLLMTSEDGNSVLFAPIETVTYQDGDLVMESESDAKEIGGHSQYDVSKYQSAPRGARTLQDAIDQNRLSAR